MPSPTEQDQTKGPSLGRAVWVGALLLLTAYAALSVAAMWQVDRTIDEPNYFNSARYILVQGWDHPAARLHGPIPYYFNQLLVRDFPSGGYRPGEEHRSLLFLGRLGLLPFGLLAGTLIFVWARRLFGDTGGLFSLSLYALNPLMVGYSGLLAVDICHSACVLLSFYLLFRFLLRPGWGAAIGVGLGLGLAFGTKYLALFSGPWVVVLAMARTFWVRKRGGTNTLVAAACNSLAVGLAITVVAMVALHACYGFQVGLSPTDPDAYDSRMFTDLMGTPVVAQLLSTFPEPYLQGVDFQMNVSEGAQYSPYLNGVFSPGRGHPGYYVWAFLLRTPEWVVALTGLWLLVRLPWLLAGRGSFAERAAVWVVVPPLVVTWTYVSFLTALQIGNRYILPTYPVLFVLLGFVPALVVRCTRSLPGARALRIAAVAAVLGWPAVELAQHWPNVIGYYSLAAGGPAQAWRYYNDSNSDWGQLRERGLNILEATEEESFEVLHRLGGPRFGRIAIQLLELVDPDPEDPTSARHWLNSFEPVRNVGGAWWLYDLKPEDWEAVLSKVDDERQRADLVVAYLGAGRNEDAERHLESLSAERRAPLDELLEQVKRGSDPAADVPTLVRLMDLWSSVGRFDQVERILTEHPSEELRRWPQRSLYLARTYIKRSRFEDAVVVLEGVSIESSPREAYLLSEAYRQLGRWEEAVNVLRVSAESTEGLLGQRARERLAVVEEEYHRHRVFLEVLE